MAGPASGRRVEAARFHHGPPARMEVVREGGRTTVVVHASPHLLVKGATAAWLGGWAVGELVALRFASAAAESLLPFFHGFALLFLAGWTLMGALAAYNLLWCFEGTEELSSDGFEFTFRRQVRGLGRTRRFALADVKNLWIRYDGLVMSADEVPPDTLVRVGFDVGRSTYRVNASLRHADAQRVLGAFGLGLPAQPPARPPPPGAAPGAGRPARPARPPPLPPR